MKSVSQLTPREYHLLREKERLQEREHRRLSLLEKVRLTIRRLAPEFSSIHAVYVFGSIMTPGRFSERSDIDVAVVCDDVAVESDFWQALEAELAWPVDVRPYQEPLVQTIGITGELVYARESDPS